MPNITIHEKDISAIARTDVTTNTIYVPGYAVTGPVDMPVYCETLDEFKRIFGTSPYIFEANSNYPAEIKSNTIYALKGDYEKSYIYASELVRNGLPIFFERVSNTNLSTAQADLLTPTPEEKYLKIRAKYPGRYGTAITYTLEKDNDIYTLTLKQGKEYKDKNNVNIVFSDKEKSETIEFSLDKNSDKYFEAVVSDIITFDSKGISISDNLTEQKTAKELSYTDITNPEFTVDNFYTKLYSEAGSNISSIFDKIVDKATYNIKFITSGSYPVFDYLKENKNKPVLMQYMLKCAATRGDCQAIIDYDIDDRLESVYTKLNAEPYISSLAVADSSDYKTAADQYGQTENTLKYGHIIGPWGTYINSVISTDVKLPGSYAYLRALASSTKSNPNWYAIAGVTRGLVPDLMQLEEIITGAIADKVQAIEKNTCSIIPIMYIRDYGYCIWGNRTLHYQEYEDLVASSFLNIRILADDVKKTVYEAARALMFETNSLQLWLNFKSKITPLLDKMITGNGLSDYTIRKEKTSKKATLKVVITLYAIEAVENFDITVEISDSVVEVS